MRELQDLENRYPEAFSPSSSSQRVGAAPLIKFAPFHHPSPMFSLANDFFRRRIIEFDQRLKYWPELTL
jgi:DNA ligase (NAD+)